MALVRWEPIRELDALHSEMDRLFSSFLGGNGNGARRWLPAMDLVEADGALVLRADLPGLDRDDVAIEIKDGVLTVSGERKAEHTDHDGGYHRIERSFGRFSRSLTLPKGVDADQVKATFDKGVLEVSIPKPEEREPYRVEIGGGLPAVEGAAEEK